MNANQTIDATPRPAKKTRVDAPTCPSKSANDLTMLASRVVFIEVTVRNNDGCKKTTFTIAKEELPTLAKASYYVLGVNLEGFEDQPAEEFLLYDFIGGLLDDRTRGLPDYLCTPFIRAGLSATRYTGDIPFGATMLTIYCLDTFFVSPSIS